MADKIYDAYHQEIELTSEQQACLKYTGDRTLMVKGYAGAGKSLVLMAIAQKYLEKYGHVEKNKVAIFTYQNTLVSTTREFLKINGDSEESIVVSTIDSYIKDIYDLLIKCDAAPKRKYFFNSPKGNEQHLQIIIRALNEHKAQYGKHRFHDLDPQFWLEEFAWMKQLNVWTDDLNYYLTLLRKGRGNKVRMSAADRVVAYQLFVAYCKLLDKLKMADWVDQTLFLVRHPELIPENKKFEHVLIDEAQDLTTVQMIAIMRLFKTDMIVAMDANQKIHSRYWTPKSLGIETTTKKLTKSMRTTVQIDALAESVRSKNDVFLSDDDKSLRAIPEREGRLPKIIHLDNAAAEQKYIVELVRSYLKVNQNITIGIIAAKNSQIKIFSEWLTTADIPHEQVTKDTTFSMAKPGVKVVTAYGAKGLEFNCVIIPMFAEGYFPYNFKSDDEEEMEQFLIKMRNLTYVSMTRAKNLLTLTFWGQNGSRFIADMDKSLYSWEGESIDIVPSSPVKTAINTTLNKEPVKEDIPVIEIKPKPVANASVNEKTNLSNFLKSKGLEVFDKRANGGCLWVLGDKSIDSILKESKKEFGALWIYSEKGGNATKHRAGWFTKSTK